MAFTADFLAWTLEQLRLVPNVTGRRMFGGYSLYSDGSIFALIAEDVLYFKTDESNRPDYEAAGMPAFDPGGDDHPMRYHAVPADILEDPERLRLWAERSVAISRRNAQKKKKNE